MNIELQMLVWSIFLGIVQISVAALAATKVRGVQWNISSRDSTLPPLTGAAGRLSRAAENFKETFPFFLAAVVIVQILSKNNSATAVGAQLYFWSRVLYVPIYAFDITRVRTLVWFAATAGIVLVLSGTF